MPWPYRILAIDPYQRGVGYVILEVPFHLRFFGRIWKTHGRGNAFTRFHRFLLLSRPDALVIEDAAAWGSRRRPRTAKLLKSIEREAMRRKIAVYKISRLQTILHFRDITPHPTKYTIAQVLAKRYPLLLPLLPPPRKPWQNEHDRLAIFDALAFAVAKLNSRR